MPTITKPLLTPRISPIACTVPLLVSCFQDSRTMLRKDDKVRRRRDEVDLACAGKDKAKDEYAVRPEKITTKA